jgi:2'-5' RNA ligase
MSDAGEARRDRHRMFFALWPDDATRGSISRATRATVQASGGRPIAKERLHLTVAFLGELTDAGVSAARSLPPLDVGGFDLTLDVVGVWPESRVLWLAPRNPPAALLELAERLKSRLAAAGFVAEDRVYRPHVTLARRARPVAVDVDAVDWPVRDLALVESFPAGRNVHYEVVGRWPLASSSTGQKLSSELQ